MPTKTAVSSLISMTQDFLVKHEGHWTHEDWESFASEVSGLGYPCDSDECRRNLGNILEGFKYFYHNDAGLKKQAPVKAKPPAKRKATVKKAT